MHYRVTANDIGHTDTQARIQTSLQRPWSDDDYDMFDDEQHVGRIMLHPQAPEGAPCFWTIPAPVPQTMSD